MLEYWTFRKRPARFERRIEFESYELVREFLDQTAELSERVDFYPDMNFGRTHVSMTINLEDEAEQLSGAQLEFARQVNVYAPADHISQSVMEGVTNDNTE